MAILAEAYLAVARFFESTLGKGGRVIAIHPLADGYRAYFETIEEDQYMRRTGREGIIAVYEAELTDGLEVKAYRRKNARSRSAIPGPVGSPDEAPIVVVSEP